MESADLNLGICRDLPGDRLDLAGLDIELSVMQQGRAKGSYAGLIALHRGKIIGLRLVEKRAHFFQIVHWIHPFLFSIRLYRHSGIEAAGSSLKAQRFSSAAAAEPARVVS